MNRKFKMIAMTRIVTIVFALISMSYASATPQTLQKSQHRVVIAVLAQNDFLPDTTDASQSKGVPEALASRVIERLNASQRFDILDRTVLRRSVLEQRFNQESATQLDAVLEQAIAEMPDVSGHTVAASGILAAHSDQLKDFKDLGQQIGADYLVYLKADQLSAQTLHTQRPYSDNQQSTSKQQFTAHLSVRIIDAKTGRIVGAKTLHDNWTTRGKAAQKNSELDIFERVAALTATSVIDTVFPPQVINDSPWIVNRGHLDGAQTGDQYTVVHLGDEIKNADGIVLGKLEENVAQITLTKVQDNFSVFTVTSGSPAQGDGVKQNPSPTAAAQKPTGSIKAHHDLTLPRIALGLVKAHSTASTGIDATQHIPTFTDTLITQLSQTKRFTVVDRQETDQLLNEQLAQALADNRELPSDMGTLAGADFLMYGSVSSFAISTQRTQLPGSSRVVNSKVGNIEGNMRIVDAHNGAIIASRRVSINQTLAGNAPEKQVISLLADAYAARVTRELMAEIYPIKVAAITPNGDIYINRGQDGQLQVGQKLSALREGDDIKDPDTGISLGKSNINIGYVALTRVEASRSVGHYQGQATLRVGDLLRIEDNVSNAPSHPKKQGPLTLAVGQIQVNTHGKNRLLQSNGISRISNDFYVKLQQTNRFNVLERSQIDQVLDEKSFTTLAQNRALAPELAKLKGADYLIHATIDDFYINTERRHIAAVNKTQVNHKGIALATLRVVNIHTGEVTSAHKVSQRIQLDKSTDSQAVVNQLIDRFTTALVNSVTSTLYPAKVLGATSNTQIYINRGIDANYKVGQQFQIVRAGEALIDPDSGMQFGNMETHIGTLEVTQVETNRSVGRLIKGSQVKRGDLLKPLPTPVTATRRAPKVNKPKF